MTCAHCQSALDVRTDRAGFSSYCAHCRLWTLSLGVLMRHSDRRLFVDAWEFITSSAQWPFTKACTRCNRSQIQVPLKVSGAEHRLEACKTCHTVTMRPETLEAFFRTRYPGGWRPPEFQTRDLAVESPREFQIRKDALLARMAGVPIREFGSGLLVITIAASFFAGSALGFWFIGLLAASGLAWLLAPKLVARTRRTSVPTKMPIQRPDAAVTKRAA